MKRIFATQDKNKHMRDGFHQLNDDEYNKLRRAIALVTVLIAGADGQIDQEEKDWALKIQKIRAYKLPERLRNYYQDVGTDYAEVVESIISNYPESTDERQRQISNDLNQMNELLCKLDNDMGYDMYKSLLSFAKHVAKATGGFLGFGSIGPDEKAWVDLPMIDPIEKEDV